MTDFIPPSCHRTAKKQHRCHYCGESILVGSQYSYWAGRYDGVWQDNKLHTECAEDHQKSGEFEFERFGNDRPSAGIKEQS